jgi:hypothetical protein
MVVRRSILLIAAVLLALFSPTGSQGLVIPSFQTSVREQIIPMTTPATAVGVAVWNIAVISGSVDTLWVDLSLTRESPDPNPCATGDCPTQRLLVNISPCPLAWVGMQGCGFSGPWRTYRVALAPGLTYTISGIFEAYNFFRDSEGSCDNWRCLYVETPADLQFTATPLAITPTTWGKVKALYRTR